jgi:hypothetical protein
MTFSKFTRGLTFGALAAGLTLTGVMAQNGTNYHVLVNTTETIFGGIGAGGAQTAADGLLTMIPGEDLKGSHTVAFSGDFGYRNPQFREMLCVLNNPVGGGQLALQFPGIVFVELDGLNGNKPAIVTNPACAAPSFPLGGTAGFIPYGLAPGASASFILSLLPSGSGLPSGTVVLLPNNGLVPSAGGTATLIAAAADSLPINSTGFCWGVQFTWIPSALASLDDVDSWAHYVVNSPDGNQYWLMSDDELNIWQSWSVVVDAGATATLGLFANDDYGLLMSTVEPSTSAALAPSGQTAAGVYYAQTENVINEFGAPALNPNGGFDVGRGSHAISLKGHAGVPNPTSGLGNQEPSLTGVLPSLGFVTWDNGGDFNGSVRLPWLSIDTAGLLGLNPATDPGVVKPFFAVRLPVVSAGFVQPITSLCWPLFGTKTKTAVSGWPDPEGFPLTAFGGIPGIAAASAQFPTGTLTVCNVPGILGVPVNITYGTTGRKDGPGKLTFNPAIADLSDSRELFLFD